MRLHALVCSDDAIQRNVLEAPWFKSSKRLCAYISCAALREVDTSKVLSEILKNTGQGTLCNTFSCLTYYCIKILLLEENSVLVS